MQKTSPTYQLDRNQKIYEEYINSSQSYNDLAKKYNLTPQRIQVIVASIQKKGLDKKLKTTDSEQKRESYKNTAVGLREQGNLTTSLQMFEQVVNWDEANDNIRGKTDVLGHIRINYTLMADGAKTKPEAIQYRQLALQIATQALDIVQNDKSLDAGKKATAQIHYASAAYQLALTQDKPDQKVLKDALKVINDAITSLPGSLAHKAWPSNIKAKIQNHLDQPLDALDTIAQAEKWLFEGYQEELKNGDQAELKILVWKSGLDLARAEIYQKHKREILETYSLESIIGQPDPKKFLTARKKEARGKRKNSIGN